jgi:hypothetical protein
MSFSATDAAFEGFRLVRRNPMAIVIWMVISAIASIGQIFAAGGMKESLVAMTEMMKDMQSSPPTTLEGWTPFLNAYSDMMSSAAWMIPVSLVLSSVLTAAVARAVLRPGEKAFGFVRLGMDEVRVFFVTLIIGILAAVFCTIIFAAAVIVGVIAIKALEGWGGLVMFLTVLGAFAFMIWLLVRWSLAIPITVAEKRFAVFDSFAATKGRFWPLLGMGLIAFIMALLVMLLCGVVSMPLSMMLGMNIAGSMDGPSADHIVKMFDVTNPLVIASAVVDAITSVLVLGVIHAPFAAAYRGIKAG